MTSLVRGWRNYWFRPAPVLNLAVARIAAAGFVVFNLLVTWRPIDDYTSALQPAHLYHPLALLRLVFRPISPEWMPPAGALEILYWVTVVFGVLALIGLATNVSLGVLAFGNAVMVAFEYSFNEIHHPEAIMAFALVFLALAPSGRALSVDRMLSRLRQTIRNRRFVPSKPLDETSPAARWPILALLWIFSLVYASAAYYKFRVAGLDWMNGYTLRYFLLQDGIRWDIPLSVSLAQNHVFAVVMSVGSLAFEATFFLTLIFPSVVVFYAIAGLLVHVGIWELMRAGFWEYMVLYFAVIPWTAALGAARARLAPGVARRRMEMVYDGECFLCLRSMTVIDALDWIHFVRPSAFQDEGVAARCAALGITPVDTRRELHLILPDRSIRRGFFAFRRLAWYVPALMPLAPLMYLPGAAWVGPRVYRFIAENRRRFEACENDACRI